MCRRIRQELPRMDSTEDASASADSGSSDSSGDSSPDDSSTDAAVMPVKGSVRLRDRAFGYDTGMA